MWYDHNTPFYKSINEIIDGKALLESIKLRLFRILIRIFYHFILEGNKRCKGYAASDEKCKIRI